MGQRYNGPANGYDRADAVAVSPGGQTVFVTGHSQSTVSVDLATIAYNAATGARLWVSRYGNSAPTSLAVSPDGRTVFVTGTSGSGAAYTTVAYDAATGARLWARHYPGGGAWSEAISPDGSMVFVTGDSRGTTSADYATIAYSAATGKQMWVSRYNGPAAQGEDFAFAVAASPDGKMVLVSGDSGGGASGASDFATIAYDAATGAQLWLTRYNSDGDGDDHVHAMAVSPDGKAVFVTGTGGRAGKANAYTTIAYSTATGAQLWLRRYSVSGNQEAIAHSVVVSPSGDTVYVTGDSLGGKTSDDYATLAYRAATGAQLWVQRYNGPANSADAALSAAVSPTMNSLFVTGLSQGQASGADYLTIAYRR
jgi:WD40 repeat protein